MKISPSFFCSFIVFSLSFTTIFGQKPAADTLSKQPKSSYDVIVIVRDVELELQINDAKIQMIDTKTQKPISATYSIVHGGFLAKVAAGSTTDLIAEAPGFTPASATINDVAEDKRFILRLFKSKVVSPKIESKTFGTIEKGKSVTLNNIYFDQSSPVLRKESFKELDELAKILSENTSLRILLRGHTDNVGDPDLNTKLSNDRCYEVVKYLIQKGIKADRLQSEGRGQSNPIAPNDTEANRKKNRRVEFVVL
jgi:outer membrane protein OmpA-like peptidoglycan-associated protein